MEKVLLFIDWFLPGTNSGGPVSSYDNMTDHLDHEFFVVTRNTDYCSEIPYQNIKLDQWNRLKENVFVFYLPDDNVSKNTFLSLYHEINPDFIMINGIYSLEFSILPLLTFKSTEIKKIVSARGMLNPQAFTTGAFKKKLCLRLLNLFGCYKKVTFHATNLEEETHIKKILPNVKTLVAPNLPKKLSYTEPILKDKNAGELTICSFARISPEKGTLHLLKALCKVSTSYNIILHLYGSIYNQEYWGDCLKVIETTSHTVEYKGTINGEEVVETMSKYDLMMLLSEGENYGHSIVEAWSASIPVLISDRTPWRLLHEIGVGHEFPIDNNLEAFSQVIEQMAELPSDEYNEIRVDSFNHAKSILEDENVLLSNQNLFNPANYS